MKTKKLKDLLKEKNITIAPGCFDALSALLIQRADFHVGYISGANIAYHMLGRPDIGFLGMSDVAEFIKNITSRVNIPMIVDADTGYGNEYNAYIAVKLFTKMGAGAIQIEDQVMPKRCGHLKGKNLIAKNDMVLKIKASIKAAKGKSLIIARTDAIAVNGFNDAIDRAHAYANSGADMLFIEAPKTKDQLNTISKEFAGKVLLMANMVEGGSTPISSAQHLSDLGFNLAIYPGSLSRSYLYHAERFLAQLKNEKSTKSMMKEMYDISKLNEVIGLNELMNSIEGNDVLAKSKSIIN